MFLLLILTLLLLYIVKKVNLVSKDVFMNKLENFNSLIDDKDKKLEELNEIINKKEKIMSDLNESINVLEKKQSRKKEITTEVILPKGADYEDENILKNYKKIRENFNFNKKNIIISFINNGNNCDINIYYTLKKIRSYFSYDVIYKIMSYDKTIQRKIVDELLLDNEKVYVKDLLSKNFNINRFISKLDERLTKANPEILIYSGDKSENFDYLSKLVRTIYDESITEGFKIEYKGVIYDYSI